MRRRWALLLALSVLLGGAVPSGHGDEPAASPSATADQAETDAEALAFFENSVRPILAEKCYGCHSAEKQRGGLRVDHRSFLLQGGDLGPALDLEEPHQSQLLRAIRYEDLEMPPTGRLPEEQLAILTRWVEQGAVWPDEEPTPAKHQEPDPAATQEPHWAYQPLLNPALPQVADGAWSSNPIDRFIFAKLAEQGLTPSPAATAHVLQRRLSYNLVGLPPAAVQSLAPPAGAAVDPQIYAAWVDQLLARPEFGEQWGRHWLDLVRYAETNGYERDGPKENAWRYRDYVIRAHNMDKPYDRFAREQLAGDELADRDHDALIATGYYRLGLWDDEPADADQAFYDSLDDVVSTTGLVFLGTTMGCARCHDHKIDPIPQRDYYRMLAYFHNIYKDIRDLGTKRSAFSLNTQTELASTGDREEFARRMAAHQEQLDRQQQTYDRFEQQVYASFSNPEKEDAADSNVRRQMVNQRAASVLSAEEFAQFDTARRELRRLRRTEVSPLPRALTVRENGRVAPPTHVLIRGSAHALGEEVSPGFPVAFSPYDVQVEDMPPEIESSGRRTAFANWLVDPRNPLTARVIVNRVWQFHFGRGIVRTTSDFGRYGEKPTHPELLDYLAGELIRHDWQLKWLHRLIVTSQAYQMASSDRPEGLAADPENHLFWRFDMRRLTAEELRDTVLSVTGQLNRQQGGPSVYSKIPDEIRQSASRPDAAWGNSPPADQVRRSVYVFVKRSVADPVLIGFDAADTDGSCPVRFATTVPTQSLTSLNGQFFNEQAAILAADAQQQAGDEADAFVTCVLSRSLGRVPTEEEIARGTDLLQKWQSQDGVSSEQARTYFCLMALNLNEMIYLD